MKQITFSDKQFYDLLQFTSEYTANIIERAVDWGDSTYAEELSKIEYYLLGETDPIVVSILEKIEALNDVCECNNGD